MASFNLKLMTSPSTQPGSFTPAAIRKDFPILGRSVNEQSLIYFDNAATTQKPNAVIDRLVRFYREENANIHRGVHVLSQEATAAYEAARETVARFIGAPAAREVIFTRGTTEAINLVASTLGRARLGEGDCVLLTEMEHHANIVPWQLLAAEKKLRIEVAPVYDTGALDVEGMKARIRECKPAIVAFSHASNAVGCINPAKELIAEAHAAGAVTVLDGAQSAAHFRVNVQDLNCDFFAFSGHKVMGPTGIGVLYGKESILADLPPYQGGGDMIEKVSFKGTTFRGLPERYEAGTPNIAGAIGLAAALEYVGQLDRPAVEQHEQTLLDYAVDALKKLDGIQLYGGDGPRVSLVSFLMDGVHPHDIGSFLDAEGIAVRTGHHCAQPLMERLGITGTSRASFAFYNTTDEIDRLAEGLKRIQRIFGS